MPKRFEGSIELDVRDSKPSWDAFLADGALPKFESTGGKIVRSSSAWPTTPTPTSTSSDTWQLRWRAR